MHQIGHMLRCSERRTHPAEGLISPAAGLGLVLVMVALLGRGTLCYGSDTDVYPREFGLVFACRVTCCFTVFFGH